MGPLVLHEVPEIAKTTERGRVLSFSGEEALTS